ncbi:MAG: hypothetical protein AM325_007770 [Candidatus Thorarchaeota archaeon SMTZ1-45]|nr:MAG: hypothetical protein AM325_09495 [Candidatus Thorarchaeota archaeon SMTZ1-45]
MVKEIIILREGGILLFHYSVSGTRRLDELTAAFLSAVDSFAQEVSQDRITVMSFAKNKLVWEKKGDLYFIALVSEEDSGEIHRVILQDLAEQFVSMFYSELRRELPESKKFRPFADTVEVILQKFDGIPGLARRYKTILLPAQDLNTLKRVLSEVEVNRDILRGGMVTFDGHVAVSNLRAYELEAVLDFLPTIKKKVEMRDHSSIEKGTSFLFMQIPKKGVSAFIVKLGMAEKTYLDLVNPFTSLLQLTSFENARKFEPDKIEGPISFYDYDAVEAAIPIEDIRRETKMSLSSFSESVQVGALRLVNSIDKTSTVAEVVEASGLIREQADEILAQLIAKGVVRISKLFPVMEDRDERFVAYLEVIGIKKRDFDIVDSIWKYCNGSLSLREISERSEIPAQRILEVLRTLGNHVDWLKERMLSHVR